MNPFPERYKTFSTADLLGILDNQSDYRPEAIEAAQAEIQQRNLSEQALTDAKNELIAVQEEKQKQQAQRAAVATQVKSLATTAFDAINPIQTSAPTTEKLIRWITIVFGLITITKWYNQFWLAILLLYDLFEGDLSVLEFFLPFILLTVGTILFGFRKKAGWVLLTTFLIYSAISSFGLIIMTWGMEPIGIPALDSIFPQTSPFTYLLLTLFFGTTLWVVTKKEIKESFHINRPTARATALTATGLTLLYVVPFIVMSFR